MIDQLKKIFVSTRKPKNAYSVAIFVSLFILIFEAFILTNHWDIFVKWGSLLIIFALLIAYSKLRLKRKILSSDYLITDLKSTYNSQKSHEELIESFNKLHRNRISSLPYWQEITALPYVSPPIQETRLPSEITLEKLNLEKQTNETLTKDEKKFEAQNMKVELIIAGTGTFISGFGDWLISFARVLACIPFTS